MAFKRPDQLQQDAHVLDWRLAHHAFHRDAYDRLRDTKLELRVHALRRFGLRHIYNSQNS